MKRNGGAGLINIAQKDIAQKLKWIFVANSDPVIKACSEELLQNKIGDLIWQLQIEEKDFTELCLKCNFWTELLKAWCKFTFKPPQSDQEVHSEVIWYNSNIRVNNKVINYPNWINKGIKYVNDLCTTEGKLLTYQEFCQKYSFRPPKLKFNGIISAIPKQWKEKLSFNSNFIVTNMFTELKAKGQISHIVYHRMMENPQLLVKKRQKLNEICEFDYTNEVSDSADRLYRLSESVRV